MLIQPKYVQLQTMQCYSRRTVLQTGITIDITVTCEARLNQYDTYNTPDDSTEAIRGQNGFTCLRGSVLDVHDCILQMASSQELQNPPEGGVWYDWEGVLGLDAGDVGRNSDSWSENDPMRLPACVDSGLGAS